MNTPLAVALPAAFLAVACAAPHGEPPPAVVSAGAEVGWVPVVRAGSAPTIDADAGEAWSPAVSRRLER